MGSLTLLFRQPVAALQVQTNDKTWKWVRPQTDAITVNIADALQFLTSQFKPVALSQTLTYANNNILSLDGYLKSSIHRVVAPPKDQAHINRLGVLYMVRIEDDTDLVPISESPVLAKRGLVSHKILGNDGKPLKAGEWVRQRVIKSLGATSTEAGDHAVTDLEIVNGVKVTYFD